MVRLLNATYRHPGGGGIEGVTLEIQTGEFILLVGRTGAGKTTILRLISLELKPQSGDVMLERMRAGDLRPSELPSWRRRLGIVYQDLRLLDDRTLYENIILAANCEPNLPQKPKTRAIRALTSVGLAHKLRHYPHQLSAGEQQRAALSRAVVNEPYVLLADEPVSHLDAGTSEAIVSMLQRVNQAGTAVVVATHQPERFEVARPRVLRIDGGRVVGQ